VRTATLLATIGLLIAACGPEAITPSASRVPPAPTPQPTAATSAPSPTLNPSPTPAGAAPTAVRFLDPLHGWLGTQDGLFSTKDGGATWDRQLGGGSITRIWSYDATHAWALASDNALYRTQDGLHWTPIEPRPNPPITQLDAFSPDLLWAVGVTPATDPQPAQVFGNVMRSVDGGASWHPYTTTYSQAAPISPTIVFGDAQTGYATVRGAMQRTTDGGGTWSSIRTPGTF